MTDATGRFVLSDPVEVLIPPYADWWSQSQFSGVVPEPIQGTTTEATRAAGHDVTPGHDELHHYWTVGPGLAKWHDFTSLYDHLVKYVNPAQAKRMAAAWFHERFGFWPGSDKNRLMHGKKPRGDRVGPG